MGQPVTVIEKPSSVRRGIVRFETNRTLTGTEHERFTEAPDLVAERPVDELARRLFSSGLVRSVHVNANAITVELVGDDSSGLRESIEELFTYYRPGVRVPTPEDFADPEAEQAEAAES